MDDNEFDKYLFMLFIICYCIIIGICILINKYYGI